jgi:hypothetical protein
VLPDLSTIVRFLHLRVRYQFLASAKERRDDPKGILIQAPG